MRGPQGRGVDVVGRPFDARALLLQRRSAVAFDGRSTIDRATFFDAVERPARRERTVDTVCGGRRACISPSSSTASSRSRQGCTC